MTQADIDRALDAAITKFDRYKVADYNGNFVGECVSLNKQIFKMTTGKNAPPTGTGYAPGWLSRPGLLKDFFNAPVAYDPSKEYPRGSWFFSVASTHVGAYLGGQGNSAQVFEQNADPDKSPAHTGLRAGNKISHIMTWKTSELSNQVNGGIKPMEEKRITTPTIETLRIIHAFVSGWDITKSLRGDYDEQFKSAAGWKDVNSFIYEQFQAAGAYRARLEALTAGEVPPRQVVIDGKEYVTKQ